MDPLFFLRKDSFLFPPGKKVIKTEEYLAYLEGKEIVARAHEEARRIVDEARQVYEAEKERGYREGVEKGKAAMSQRMLETVGKTVDYFGSVEEKLCSIVIEAVRKVIGEIDEAELVQRVVRNALALARNQKEVILRVSPSQADLVKAKINEIIAAYPGISFVDVVADARLKEGGCILESEIGIVDASLDVQIEAIRRSLTKTIKQGK